LDCNVADAHAPAVAAAAAVTAAQLPRIGLLPLDQQWAELTKHKWLDHIFSDRGRVFIRPGSVNLHTAENGVKFRAGVHYFETVGQLQRFILLNDSTGAWAQPCHSEADVVTLPINGFTNRFGESPADSSSSGSSSGSKKRAMSATAADTATDTADDALFPLPALAIVAAAARKRMRLTASTVPCAAKLQDAAKQAERDATMAGDEQRTALSLLRDRNIHLQKVKVSSTTTCIVPHCTSLALSTCMHAQLKLNATQHRAVISPLCMSHHHYCTLIYNTMLLQHCLQHCTQCQDRTLDSEREWHTVRLQTAMEKLELFKQQCIANGVVNGPHCKSAQLCFLEQTVKSHITELKMPDEQRKKVMATDLSSARSGVARYKKKHESALAEEQRCKLRHYEAVADAAVAAAEEEAAAVAAAAAAEQT
jgi:hypothetical protein